jgi:quinol monooxygenase YgiN
MLSVVATVKVKADKLEEAKAFFKQLAADIAANEPGTLQYDILQRKDDPKTFVVYEKYESDEAFAIHSKNLGAKGAEFMAVLDGAPDVVLLDQI